MTRTQAIGLVHSLNGHCQSSVTSKTNFLVCGQYSKSLFDDSLYTKRNKPRGT
ncbi:hypothetical protein LOS19_14635 [Enterococcus faecium]|nr:hypothetical protein [Enterococcus faecium]MCC9082079.1 hypothetical protein [Enterococcus faecium]MCC9085810.1 hypothetical protein [Enterococcus faecium]MCC9087010.1 hypothetical protein [Enterococcus faecium]